MPFKGMPMLSWQLALTAEALGLDSNIALELILMITNTQALGVPIRYASIPGSISAFCSLLFIPMLGIVTDRWAKSKISKAKILLTTAGLQLTGSLCVFTANALKLFLCNSNHGQYHWKYIEGPSSLSINDTLSSSYAIGNNTLGATSVNTDQNHILTDNLEIESQSIPFYAYIAMLGYCFMDAGYDFGGCFLKTFVLHCTPLEHQVGVLVNLNLISSVGAVITSVLASIDVGATITAGTNYDSNAALTLVTSAVSSTLLLVGTITSLITGFCWKPPISISIDESKIEDLEELVLIAKANDKVTTECQNSSFKSKQVSECSIANGKEKNSIHSDCTLGKRPRYHERVLSVLKRHKKQIQLNIMTFGTMSAVACFGVFCTNFVATGIYKGDPAAPSGSKEYQQFLKGVTIGSQGTLIYFVVFAITSFFHHKSLDLFGWKKETIIVTFSYFILCAVLALSKNIYIFYITSIGTGVIRTVSMTVPYILVNKISAETSRGNCSSVAISLIATMLPCGMFICGTVMGPLIHITGSPDVSMWYAGVTAPLVEPQHSYPIPRLQASDDKRPQLGPMVPQSEMLHFNLSAISDSISVLRPLTCVFKVCLIEINHDVAENIKKVLAHRLNKEMRAKVEADVRILSNFEQI
ncbi:hypothetical protein RRG08_032220 [Elysia crispata]|uniref:Uncharacterized protein n=1 Tax=Elysia crispata TaxID=231223 RepID=A0AAE1AZB1_9GAST|nr:hypothetical protein RRG08_032220 [Elysia crispata]